MNKEHIQNTYNRMSKNFMTPDVRAYEIQRDMLIELSRGTGIDHDEIWAVTVMKYNPSCGFEKYEDYGQLFQGEKAETHARTYYSNMLKKF